MVVWTTVVATPVLPLPGSPSWIPFPTPQQNVCWSLTDPTTFSLLLHLFVNLFYSLHLSASLGLDYCNKPRNWPQFVSHHSILYSASKVFLLNADLMCYTSTCQTLMPRCLPCNLPEILCQNAFDLLRCHPWMYNPVELGLPALLWSDWYHQVPWSRLEWMVTAPGTKIYGLNYVSSVSLS